MKWKVAVCPFQAQIGDVSANLERAEQLIREAASQGAQVVLLQELWSTGYDLSQVNQLADPEGQTVEALMSRLARELNLHIVAGAIALKREERTYDTVLMFDPSGQRVLEYDKAHLFTVTGEENYFQSGSEIPMVEIMGVKCAVMICYDIRFPELARQLALAGAQVLFVPAAWGNPRLHHWRTLNTARAIENQMFVISCNGLDRIGEASLCGNSMIIDPWGEVLLETGEQEGVFVQEIDLSMVADVRQRVPVFKDRRPELYR